MDNQNQDAAKALLVSGDADNTALIYKRIGRASVYRMQIKLLTVLDILELKKIKESKQYKGFVHIDENGNREFISTWEEYCPRVEGRSRHSIDNEILNLEVLGTGLFEALRDVGAGPGIMREIRRLPEDEKQLIEQASQAGSKDEIVELIDALVAKHHQEKEALETKARKAEAKIHQAAEHAKSLLDQQAAEYAKEIANRDEDIRSLDKQIENQAKNNEKIEKEKVTLQTQLRAAQGRQTQAGYNPQTVSIRMEAAAADFGVRLHVDELTALYEAALEKDAPSAAEKELRVTSVAMGVSAAFAHVHALYERLVAEVGEAMPIQPGHYTPLTDYEKELLNLSIIAIRADFGADKSARAAKREVAQIAKGGKTAKE
jgi:hypothetical protein